MASTFPQAMKMHYHLLVINACKSLCLSQHSRSSLDTKSFNGSDAEHPTIIPMDLPSSHQEPRGPMTRERARALENEVTSFLSDITYDPLETWLLPKSDMLCMIRCQEKPPEDAREDGQAAKSMDEGNQRKRAS